MQINLNEADIIEAIEEHVRKKVNFDADVEVVIDLKATRGPEGFTATIDLGSPAPKATPEKATRAPRTPKTAPEPEPEKEVEKEPAQEAPQEAAEQPSAETPAGVPVDENGDAADAGETPPAEEKPKSLFANLGKPRND